MLKVTLRPDPGENVPVSNAPLSLVTEWGAESWFIHVTTVPASTVMEDGWKEKRFIVTVAVFAAEGAAGEPAADGAAPPAVAADGEGAACGGDWAAQPSRSMDAKTDSRSITNADFIPSPRRRIRMGGIKRCRFGRPAFSRRTYRFPVTLMR